MRCSTPRQPRSCWWALVAALLTVVPALGQRAYDRWYIVELNGAKAGWAHETRRIEGDRVTTASDLDFSVRRQDLSVRMRYGWEFQETRDGRPLEMVLRLEDGNVPLVTRWTFGDAAVRKVIHQGATEREETVPPPAGHWLPPAAASRFLLARLGAGAETIEVRTVDPSQGLEPVVIRYAVQGRREIEALGRRIAVYECVSEQQAGGETLRSLELIDDEGLVVEMRTESLGLTLTLRIADRRAATEHAEPPEIMVSTFVRPVGRIDRPRETTAARYVLSLPGEELPSLPAAGFQRVQAGPGGRVRVEVDLERSVPAAPEDVADQAYRLPSARLDSTDEEVVRLARRAARGAGPAPLERCEALRRAVYRHIRNKDLGVAFASASEVARSGQGDCSEHAMLLAAMLRAEGIPSRVVSGLIYTEEFAGQRHVFAYHMWTQALVQQGEGWRWVDLDATLGPERPFDAAHIALVCTGMADGEGYGALVPLVRLLGRLTVEVEWVR